MSSTVEHSSQRTSPDDLAVVGYCSGVLSSNDPVFHLHHCYIDRLWARWQGKGTAYLSAYNANPNLIMPGSSTAPKDWFDLTAQQNNPAYRVCYVDPPSIWWVDTVLATASVARNSFYGYDTPSGYDNGTSAGTCRSCGINYDDCGDSPSYGYGSASNYFPVKQPCQTVDSLSLRAPLHCLRCLFKFCWSCSCGHM